MTLGARFLWIRALFCSTPMPPHRVGGAGPRAASCPIAMLQPGRRFCRAIVMLPPARYTGPQVNRSFWTMARGIIKMQVQQVARAGISVALLAVSAWVTIPLGPVPFTLQTMVLAMLPAVLDRRTACLAVGAYLLLGALGLPVFSGFGAGLGTIAGPTGGFLWGFLIGSAAGSTLFKLLEGRAPILVRTLAADVVMLLISYACGTAQLMMVAQLDLVGALMVAVVPFVVPDAIKMVVGAQIGCTVARSSALAA